MSLQEKVMEALKEAMKAKDSVKMESLRAIKSAILLANTEAGASGNLSEADEIKLLQRLVKQRKDSALLYEQQGRADLATTELTQVEIISKFLPEQLNEAEITAIVKNVIEKIGASGIKDIGKVMGEATKELTGKAEGKVISDIVKKLLT